MLFFFVDIVIVFVIILEFIIVVLIFIIDCYVIFLEDLCNIVWLMVVSIMLVGLFFFCVYLIV